LYSSAKLVPQFHASVAALALIAAVAVTQLLLVLTFASAQADGARMIERSVEQGSRTQSIAYEVTTARFGSPDRNWRARVEAAIREMVDVRALLRRDPRYLEPLRDAHGKRRLDRDIAAYVASARELERDPQANAPFARMGRMRPALLREFESSVAFMTGVVARRARILAGIVVACMVVLLATIVLAWSKLLAPVERRNRDLVTQLSNERSRLISFFEKNPDAIAIYDVAGYLLHSNPARSKLLGADERDVETHVGRHISTFMNAVEPAAALAAFERASHGETATSTSRLLGKDEWIDVESTLFPYDVDGKLAGVIIVSKDVRALKAARADRDVQAKRITALYEIAAARGRTWQRQVTDALALASSHLDCEWGVVTEVVEDTVTVVAAIGKAGGLEVGDAFPVGETLSGAIIVQEDVWEVDDILASGFRQCNLRNRTGWRSIVGIRICINDSVYGTFALGHPAPRTTPLREMDRDFVRVVATLLGSIIERGLQEKKLDALAFFDALTGLPNRVLVHDKIEEMIAGARRRQSIFALHFIDLDKFKQVNDTGGHAAGDEVLRLAARRLQQCVRESDIVARLGGDEFVIVQGYVEDAVMAGDLPKRIIESIERPFAIEGYVYKLSCSVGVSYYPADGIDAPTLMSRADQAMYRAKWSDRPAHAVAESGGAVPEVSEHGAQAGVVEDDGRGLQVVHLDEFAQERIEEPEPAEDRLVRDEKLRPVARGREDALEDFPRADRAGPGEVECGAVRARIVGDGDGKPPGIRRERVLTRPLERPDDVGAPPGGRGDERVADQALLDVWPVEIGQSQDRRSDAPGGVGFEHEVLLRFAHPALERVGLARMALVDRGRERQAVGVDVADQDELPDSRPFGALERRAHEDRVKFELPVRHADRIDDCPDARRSRPDRRRVRGIPGHALG
jgi:diguanylate cyclase (GGDEF)-like protein/PAS domain S-box-containing protein